MKKINVACAGGYTVNVGAGILADAGNIIRSAGLSGKAAVVTDETVGKLYGETLARSLAGAGYGTVTVTIPAGEENKNPVTYVDVLRRIAGAGLGRGDFIAALGGGVVGDIAGFAAATYMRGIAYVQIPTTLLAAVDSSVGGKTGIDLPEGKNLAGCFYQPSAVVCDTEVIAGLPRDIFAEGMAEVIKYAVLSGEDLPSLPLEDMICRCVSIKAETVARDETDRGERRSLNFGHTAAHVYERLSGYTLPHGKAVAAGMMTETLLAEKLGAAPSGLSKKVAEYLEAAGLPLTYECEPSEFVGAAMLDKKNGEGKIGFSLPTGKGWRFEAIYPEALLEYLEK